jgi:hypothetical protein
MELFSQPANPSSVMLAPGERFDSVRVFSASMHAARHLLGEQVTDWIAFHPQHRVTEIVVTQSSDSAYHCISITLFFQANARSR